MATHSRILPGKSHGQRSLVGYSPWGRRESDPTERYIIPMLYTFMISSQVVRGKESTFIYITYTFIYYIYIHLYMRANTFSLLV